jgi:hypothetical protein
MTSSTAPGATPTGANVADHPFDRAIALTDTADGRVQGHTSRDYWNQVGPYGGITAAVVLQAILRRPERLGDPLSLTINFAGPVPEGPFELDVQCVRTNRGTQHWSVLLRGGDDRQVAISAVAVFAVRREAWSALEAAMPEVPAADSLTPVRAPVNAAWFRRYQMRFVRGAPMQPNPDTVSQLWINDDPPRPLDFASLTAICDTFVPRIFLRRPRFVPIATVSMNVYFHVDAERLARYGTEPVLAVAEGQVFHEGFFDHEGQIWGSDRHLLATTHQIMWYKE